MGYLKHLKKLPSDNNPRLFLLLGAHAADGHLRREGYKWEFFEGHESAAKFIKNLVYSLFEITPSMTYCDRHNEWIIRVYSKEFCRFIASYGFPYGRKIGYLHVPSILWKRDASCKKAFINGVFGADGTVTAQARKTKEPRAGICLRMADLNFVDELAILLRDVGFNKFSMITESPRKLSPNPQRGIVIRGNQAVKQFLSTVGLWHPVKIKRVSFLDL